MSRPHIEFIQAQTLPWEQYAQREGTRIKYLSVDQDTGDCTAIVSYPRQWQGCVSHEQSVEEFFVLEGQIRINDETLSTGAYGWLPCGFSGRITSEEGASILSFFEPVEIGRRHGPPEKPLFVDTVGMMWSNATDPNVKHASVGLKELRLDEKTGERTWLLQIDLAEEQPFEINGVERHPVVEELFVLEGSIAMPTGCLNQGAYFWRPPGLAHGPTRVTEKFVGFFRCKGGAFTTEWSEAEAELPKRPRYNPVLPEGLKVFAAKPYDERLRF